MWGWPRRWMQAYGRRRSLLRMQAERLGARLGSMPGFPMTDVGNDRFF